MDIIAKHTNHIQLLEWAINYMENIRDLTAAVPDLENSEYNKVFKIH